MRVRRAFVALITFGVVHVATVAPAGAHHGSYASWEETFNNIAPALPAGWSTACVACQPGDPAWVTFGTVGGRALADAQPHVTDNRLESPAFTPPTGGARLEFTHAWRFAFTGQTRPDGGVLEMQINNGAWTDILAAGATCTAGCYGVSAIDSNSNPLVGRRAWSADSFATIPTTFVLPASAIGQSVRLRWRMGTNNNNAGGTNQTQFWSIDNVAVTTTPRDVTVEKAAGQDDPTSTSPINFTATFGDVVTGFTGADVSLAGSTTPGTLTVDVTGGPTVYNIAVSGMIGPGDVAVSIPATGADGKAPTDQGNHASTSSDNVVTFNAPALTSKPGVVNAGTTWRLRNTLDAGPPTVAEFSYGTKPNVPLVGDWDGDGTRTPGSFEGGVFKLRNSYTAGAPDQTITFGDPRGFPVAGDIDGDGRDDLAVVRASIWEFRLSSGQTLQKLLFGAGGTWPNEVPVVGDWDGDGTAGIGYMRRDTGNWNLLDLGDAPFGFAYQPISGGYPVVGDWDGDGVDTVGVKAVAGAGWALSNSNSSAAPTITFDYGASGDLPVAWR